MEHWQGSVVVDHLDAIRTRRTKLIVYCGAIGMGIAMAIGAGILFFAPPDPILYRELASDVPLTHFNQTCISNGAALPRCWEQTVVIDEVLSHFAALTMKVGRTAPYQKWSGSRALNVKVGIDSEGADLVGFRDSVSRRISCAGDATYCAATSVWRAPKLQNTHFQMRVQLLDTDAVGKPQDLAFIGNVTFAIEYDNPDFVTFVVLFRYLMLFANLAAAGVYMGLSLTKRATLCQTGCRSRARFGEHAALGDDFGGGGAEAVAAAQPRTVTGRNGGIFKVWGRRSFLNAYTTALLLALILWNDPFVVFKYISADASQVFQSIEDFFEVTFIACLLLYILVEFEAIAQPPVAPSATCALNDPQCKKFLVAFLPKLVLLAVYNATFTIAYLYITHLKHNEPLFDWTQSHDTVVMLQIGGGVALLFYVGWLVYIGARSSSHIHAMTPSRQATFALYCAAVCSAILCIGAVSVMNWTSPSTSSADTITDVPIFSFGFNAFVWTIAFLHAPLQRAPPRPLAAGEGEELFGSCLSCRLPGSGPQQRVGAGGRRETEMVGLPALEAEPELATVLYGPGAEGGSGGGGGGEDEVEILTALPPAPPAQVRLVE